MKSKRARADKKFDREKTKRLKMCFIKEASKLLLQDLHVPPELEGKLQVYNAVLCFAAGKYP